MSIRLLLRVRWGRQRRGINVLFDILGGFSFFFVLGDNGIGSRNGVIFRT